MAHIVTPTIILDSSKSAIVHVYIESDGVSSDLSNFVIVDPKTDFANSPLNGVKMVITQVWYSLAWFDGTLGFSDVNPPVAWVLNRDATGYQDFRYFGGLRDRSGIDGLGQLLLSTNGLTPYGNKGTMVVEMRKSQQTRDSNYTPSIPYLG